MLDEILDIKASVWISASAGTGKTKSLIDRILALLLGGVTPSRILCLTYTKAAATEMLERLANYLDKIYKLPDSEIVQELTELGYSEKYLSKIKELHEKSLKDNWVNIQTIHSFCLSLLEKFPLETGLFPGLKQCSDYQKKTAS